MADRIKDAEDRFIESMFELSPVADDGFSDRIVKRIRRRMWLRRLALPSAAVIGGLLAFKPAVGLVSLVQRILLGMPNDLLATASDNLPSVQLIVTGAMILGAALMSLNMLED